VVGANGYGQSYGAASFVLSFMFNFAKQMMTVVCLAQRAIF